MASPDIQEVLAILSSMNRESRQPRPPVPSFEELTKPQPFNFADSTRFKDFRFPEKNQSPSFLSRVFDVLSRPLYTVAEPARMLIEPGFDNPLELAKGAWGGFSGKKKTRGVDVLLQLDQRVNDNTYEESVKKFQDQPGAVKFMASLGLDVGMDPLTYLNPFSIGSKFKKPVNIPEFQGAQKASSSLLEKTTPPNLNQFTSRSGRYENNLPYKSVLSSLDARASQGFMASNATKTVRDPDALVRSTFNPQITGMTSPVPNTMKLPNGIEIPLGTGPNVSKNLTPNNVASNMVMPLRESQVNTRLITPERVPTANELNFEIPAAFRAKGNPAPSLPMSLPRTDYGMPYRGPRANLTAPESAIGPSAQQTLGRLEEAYVASNKNPIFAPKGEYKANVAATANQVEDAGFPNLGSAKGVGTSQMNRIEARMAENAAARRTAEGFQNYKASKNAGMPYPQASKAVEAVANPPRPVLRQVDQEMADDIATKAVDDISKGGRVQGEAKVWDEFGTREQANTWNSIVTRLKANGVTKSSQVHLAAYRIMQSVEDKLVKVGYQPLYRAGKGAPARGLRLTHVIDELGGPGAISSQHMTKLTEAFVRRNPSMLRKTPKLQQALERVIARDYAQASASVERAVNKASGRNALAEQVLSPGAVAKWRRENLVPYMESTMRGEGASVSAVSAARKIIDDLNKAKLPVRERLSKADKAVVDGVMKRGAYSRKTADVTAAQMRNLGQQLDVQWKKLGEEIGDASKAAEAMRATIAAHWGMGDVRALFNSEVQQGIAQSSAKANYLASIARGHSKTEINEAWRAMQGLGQATNPRILALQRNLEQTIDTLISPVGTNSVAKSSMTLQKDLNTAMRRLGEKFQFTNDAKHVDEFGRTHDFSQNADWLNSWKTAKVDEPLEFMLKIDTALEQITHRYAAFDNLAARYGSRQFGGEYRYKVPKIERMNGYYFPKEIGERLISLDKSINDLYSPNSPLLKHFDNVMTAMKAGMTIYNPSHHIRNMVGDIFNSWMAGVNGVRPYKQAAKVIGSQRSRYREYPGLRELTNDDAFRNALTRRGDVVARNKSGVPFTAEQIYLGAHGRGLLQSAGSREELVGKQLMPKPLGGRVQKVARGASELRDHEMRLAHFIDYINKSKGKNVDEIFERGAMEVRKWHPDGLDLTGWEKKYMRRIFPFYSWTRKAIPLMVESAVKQPGKVLMYPRGMSALQQSMGTQGDGVSNPFPADQLFPEWIREKGIGPIGNAAMNGPAGLIGGLGRTETNMFGDESGYTVVNPSNPFIDLGAQFGGMGRPSDPYEGMLSMLNPFLKVPYELNRGKEALTDAPIAGREADYWTKQIPIVSAIGRITNTNITGGPSSRGEKEGRFNLEAFLNWLSASGVTGTGPLETSAKIEEDIGRYK